MFYADAHCDTLTEAMSAKQGLRRFDGQLNLDKLSVSFGGCLQFMAICCEKREDEAAAAFARAALDFFGEQAAQNADILRPVLTKGDAHVDGGGKIGVLLSLEGGEPLCGKIENLREFYGRGVRSLCLTWNYANALGGGAKAEPSPGLTAFGKEVIREMNELGMAADVSHANERTFWAALDACEGAVIASHSNAFALCPHPRNLKDAQLRAIGQKGGFAGFNMYPDFIAADGAVTDALILRHVERMLRYAGEDAVGLGCDFDGIEKTPENYRDVSDVPKLYGLLEREFGADIADKVFYKNIVRVLAAVLPSS